MTAKALIARVTQQESLNFLLTNRLPRNALTRLVGRLSKIDNPLVARASIGLWKLFSDLDLSEAKESQFASMHACFTRELKAGARPVDPDPRVFVSPCDTLVGECGTISAGQVLQAKGLDYPLADLLKDTALARSYEGGSYATLRLTSSMYHRFHAPADLTVTQVNYIAGDTWNVNPIALKRVAQLFCKNERAVLQCTLDGSGVPLTLVPVAAILVASIRLKFLDVLLHLKYRGPNLIPCRAHLRRGEEMGWFEHGSTIIVLAPPGFAFAAGVTAGARLKMGQALMRSPS